MFSVKAIVVDAMSKVFLQCVETAPGVMMTNLVKRVVINENA
jgi:hypothetical protein